MNSASLNQRTSAEKSANLKQRDLSRFPIFNQQSFNVIWKVTNNNKIASAKLSEVPKNTESSIEFVNEEVTGNEEVTCPICNSIYIETHGTVVCQDCGSELGPEISSRPDVQYSSDQTMQCNTIHNPLLSQFNYTTQISGGDSQLKRLNKWAHTSYLEKTLAREFRNLEEICHQAHISSSIAQTAQILYKEAVDCLLKNPDIKKRPVGLHLACLYQACTLSEFTRSHRELALICGVPESRVIRSCKIYFELIDQNQISSDIPDSKSNANKPLSPVIIKTGTMDAYVNRFVDAMGLNIQQRKLVVSIIDKVERLGVFHESPPSIVAGCLYMASIIYNFHLDKNVIAEQTGVSEVTIVKVYKNLHIYIDKLIE